MLNFAHIVPKTPIHVFSTVNEWMDCLFLVEPKDAPAAEEVLEKALCDWFDEDVSEAYGTWLESRMDEAGIEYEVFYKEDGSDDNC